MWDVRPEITLTYMRRYIFLDMQIFIVDKFLRNEISGWNRCSKYLANNSFYSRCSGHHRNAILSHHIRCNFVSKTSKDLMHFCRRWIISLSNRWIRHISRFLWFIMQLYTAGVACWFVSVCLFQQFQLMKHCKVFLIPS